MKLFALLFSFNMLVKADIGTRCADDASVCSGNECCGTAIPLEGSPTGNLVVCFYRGEDTYVTPSAQLYSFSCNDGNNASPAPAATTGANHLYLSTAAVMTTVYLLS